MKTTLLPFAAAGFAVALAACSGSNPPPAPAAPAPAAQAPATAAPGDASEIEKAIAAAANGDAKKAEILHRAEALTQEQIAQSRDLPSLTRLVQVYTEIHDTQHLTWTFEQLAQLLPNAGDLHLKLAAAYATADDKSRTYDTLLKLAAQGYAYDVSKDPAFDNAHGTKVWDYVLDNFKRNATPAGEGKVAFELPKADKLYESLAWDPKRKQFLVGSVRDGSIATADDKGRISAFIKPDASNGLMGVFGIAVDAAHDKLYAISNGVPHFQGFTAEMAGKTGVWEFGLSSGKFIARHALPEDTRAHLLSAITVDGRGGVYVADSVNNQVFRLDGGAMKLVLGNPALTGIRGLAVTADGKTLYFSDLALGIFGVDLGKTQPFNLAYDVHKLALGGIESLYTYDGALIAVQGSMQPQRVMRIKLDADGKQVTAATVLDAAQPAFDAPAGGTVVGDGLYFVANSQKDRYSNLGVLTDAAALEPTRIYRSNLRYNWDEKPSGAARANAAAAAERAGIPAALARRPTGDGGDKPADKPPGAQH